MSEIPVSRNETEVFSDLATLCREPGFVHALAAFCFRDNVWGYSKELKADDVLKKRSDRELVRTEISTLQGLMMRGEVDYSFPGPVFIQSMMDRAEALLEELHWSMMKPIMDGMASALKAGREDVPSPFDSAAALREPVFYGGDSAYDFQYLDLASQRYADDANWLADNKGFSIEQAVAFASSIQKMLPERLLAQTRVLRAQHPNAWTMLPGFTFSIDEIGNFAGLSKETVLSIISAFSDRRNNTKFETLSDFNTANSHPILLSDENSIIILQSYSLFEAIYDSPFYWMIGDRGYRDAAARGRGRFTERYTAARLASVFQPENVTENVRIVAPVGKRVLGEIDVLVVFGTRAVIVQTKSKKLTVAARKGNDAAMKGDFQAAVQDAYDQARLCAQLLGGDVELIDSQGQPMAFPRGIEVIIPMCVVADHYPALTFQTRSLLAHVEDGKLVAPFVVEVFQLDVLCELLDTPLMLLSYLERRALYNDKVMINNELAALGYHLRSNLWIDNKWDLVNLTEDLAADVDVAMMVRRAGVSGRKTPPGILDEYRKGKIGSIVSDLEQAKDSGKFDLGLMLLTLSGQTLSHLNKGIEHCAKLSRADGKPHDFTLSIAEGRTGITIHTTSEPAFVAGPSLRKHCERRKYVSRADSWFGLAVDPETVIPRAGIEIKGAWERSDLMDVETKGMRPDVPEPSKSISKSATFEQLIEPLGRNDRCWCGSGLKYKKCHLDMDDRARRSRERR